MVTVRDDIGEDIRIGYAISTLSGDYVSVSQPNSVFLVEWNGRSA